MLTRRKSSELIEPEIVKKIKGIEESNLKVYIKNKQTRKVLEVRIQIYYKRVEALQICFQFNNNVLKLFIMEMI